MLPRLTIAPPWSRTPLAVAVAAAVLVTSLAWSSSPARAEAAVPSPPTVVPGTEVVAMRTAFSKTFTTATPGRFDTRVSASPVHFRDSIGSWSEIDTSLVTGTPGRLRSAANSLTVDVAEVGGEGATLASVELADGVGVGFSLDGMAAVPAILEGSTARYPLVMPHVDLEVMSHPEGLKDELVLHSREVPDSFLFPLALDGVQAQLMPDGGVSYRDANGVERLRTPPGVMYDGASESGDTDGAVSGDVTFSMETTPAGIALRVSIDRAWLDDPARVFPVRVDPELTAGAANSASYRNPCGASFAPSQVQVGNSRPCNGGDAYWRSVVYFPYESLFGKRLMDAEVRLFGWGGGTRNSYATTITHATRFGWNCVRGGPQQSADGEQAQTFGGVGSLVYSIYEEAMRISEPGRSICFVGFEQPGLYTYKRFNSFELHLFWEEPPPANNPPFAPANLAPANGSAHSSTPRLSATFSDPDANNGHVYFAVKQGGNTVREGPGSVTSSGGPPSELDMAALPDGAYTVESVGVDSEGAVGPGSGINSFSVDSNRAPNPPTNLLPAHGSAFTSTPGFSATFSDPDANTGHVYFAVKQGATVAQGPGTTVGDTGTSTWSSPALPDGAYTIESVGVDVHGVVGPRSSIHTFTVDSKSPPGAPQSVSALPGGRSAAVSWSAPASDGGAAIDGYLVRAYRADGTPAGVEKTTPGEQTAALVDGLADDTAYYFSVYAQNRVGYGPAATSNTVRTAKMAATLTSELVAQSDELGLEQFQAYARHDLGSTDGFVQLRTGNLVVQQRDVRVPGQGLNVVVRRTYNSQDPTDNGLGAGWRLSLSDLDAALDGVEGAVTDLDPASPLGITDVVSVTGNTTQVTGQAVDFTDGDGTTHRFVRSGPLGRRWDSPPGVSLRLREVTGANGLVSAYELIRPDGVVYRAEDQQGPLGLPTTTWLVKTVTDRNGNQLNYSYEPVNVGGTLRGRLSSITHNRTSNQVAVSFDWDGPGGRLSSITSLPGASSEDPAAPGAPRPWQRRTALTYTSGHLTGVVHNEFKTAADGLRTFGYRYDANGMLDQVTDPRGNPSGLGYTLDVGIRRLTQLTDRRAKAWGYVYNAVDPNTGDRVTTATSPVGSETAYRISGRAAIGGSDLRVAGGNIRSITDSGTNAGAVTTSYSWVENRLVTRTDGVSNVTSMTYNDLGLLTKVTEPKPNRDDRSDLSTPEHPKVAIESKLAYALVPSYRYPDCTEPAPGGPEVTKVGYCDAVADLNQVVAADNIAAQRRVTDFGLDPSGNGNLRSVTQKGTGGDPDRTTSFEYYGRGGLCAVNGPRSDVSDVTRYGDAANIAAACGSGPEPLYGGYDATGLAPRIRDAALKTKDFGYTPYGMVAKVTDRDSRITRTSYDERDNPITVTAPGNRVSTRSYNANDQVLVATSPRGTASPVDKDFETRHTYDANGWLTNVSRPDATDTDPTKRVETSTQYHDDGTKASDTNAAGGLTTYAYWPNRSLKETSAPAATNGAAALTSFEYDLAGRVIRTLFPATNVAGTQRPGTLVDYTPQGQVSTQRETSFLSGEWRTTRFAYNAHGEVTRTAGPRSAGGETEATETVLNAFGEPTLSRRRLVGRWLDSATGYDAAGNKVRTTQPTGIGGTLESLYRYDALDRLVAQTKDPTNPDHEVAYTYEGEGAQLTRTDLRQTGGPQASACGDSGVSCVAARTNTTIYNPDGTVQSRMVMAEDGRTLATCNWGNPADKTAGYDADGNLLRSRTVSDSNACVGGRLERDLTMTYDHRGFMTSFVQGVRSPELWELISRNQTFEYRNDGAVTRATHHGDTTTYAHSPAGWVESITDWRGKTSSIGYTPSGALAGEDRGSGAATGARAYTADGMPASQSWAARGGAVVRDHTNIRYDVGGQRLSEDVAVVQPAGALGASTGGHATWDYDLGARLTAYTSPYRLLPTDSANPVTTYTLDDGGNITRQATTVDGVVRRDETNSYVAGQLRARRAIDGLGVLPVDTNWTYNALGEETSEASTGGTGPRANATTYDPVGHTGVVDDQTIAGPGTPNPTDVYYLYDGGDHLLTRTERPATGPWPSTLYFYWGNTTTLAEEADGLGATTARYLTDGAAETIGQHTWRRDATGHRDADDSAGTWAWLLDDSNGNTATHLADDGTVLEQAAFDPYGRPESRGKGTTANAPGSSLGHQAALTDRTTGSVVLGARQYDPTTARFTTPDTFVSASLDFALGTDDLTGNRYIFAAANPVAYYEDGHGPFDKFDLNGEMCFVKCGWRRAAGKVRDWVGSRNWGDYISGHINVYIGVGGILKGYAAMAASPLCGLAAAVCAGAGAVQTGMGVGRVWRGAVQVRRGVNRCTSHCSTRNQLIHAGLNLAPSPAGPLLRCRRGGCDNTWDAYSI